MEKVFSSPDEEGHLLSSSSLSTHRLTPTASSGLLLNSAAAYLLLFTDSRVVGRGLDLLLTCAFGLNLAPRVVFHIFMEFCMTALVDPVQIQAIQSVCQQVMSVLVVKDWCVWPCGPKKDRVVYHQLVFSALSVNFLIPLCAPRGYGCMCLLVLAAMMLARSFHVGLRLVIDP